MSTEGADAPAQIDCPWCAEPISTRAIVCRHCGRDVALPMPILVAQRAQAREIAALRAEVEELRADLAQARPEPPVPAEAAPPPVEPPAAALPLLLAALSGPVVALLLLVGLHWLLIIRYDAAPVALRTACIVVSLGVALAAPGLPRLRGSAVLGLGAVLGVAAVLGMSWNVARADGTPVLPASARDLFEMLEFAASIGFSFAAGGLVAGLVQRARSRSLRLAALGRMRGRIGAEEIKAIGQSAESLKKIMDFGAPVVALFGAVATGFRSLIGGP